MIPALAATLPVTAIWALTAGWLINRPQRPPRVYGPWAGTLNVPRPGHGARGEPATPPSEGHETAGPGHLAASAARHRAPSLLRRLWQTLREQVTPRRGNGWEEDVPWPGDNGGRTEEDQGLATMPWEHAGPGRAVIRTTRVADHWLPLSDDTQPITRITWQPVPGADIPVRDRPALLHDWIRDALGAPTVDAAMVQIFGPRALELAAA